MLGKGPGSRGDIQVKIYLPTQATIYTVADGLCTAVTWALTNNTTVLFIESQAYQGRASREGKVRWQGISWVSYSRNMIIM